jgi:predicted permease
MEAILLRALPVHRADELVILNWQTKAMPYVVHGLSGTWYGDRTIGFTSGNYPYPAFEFLRANNTVLADMFGFVGLGRMNVIVQGQSELAVGLSVSGGFFSGLGVTPAAGRLISDNDDRMTAEPMVVLSHGYWQRRFGANPRAIGQSILIDSKPHTIAGVSQPGFTGVDPGGRVDFFVSMRNVHLATSADAQRRFLDKNFYWVDLMGRLRPGVTFAQANAELTAKFRQFVEATATTAEEKADLPASRLFPGGSGTDSLRRQYTQPLYVLMTFVGLILAIGCANIASLSLARASARRREIAVRLSIGGGRMRVIRQLLTESTLLSLLGGVLGIAVAAAGIRFITWLLSNGRADFTLNAELNWPVLGFTLALSLVTGLIFGLAPAIQATRIELTSALKESRVSDAPARLRFGRALVVAQIALSLLLVVAASLFVRSLSALNSVELGFNRDNLALFSLDAKPVGYEGAVLASFYEKLRMRLSTLPGVRAVSMSEFALVSGAGAQHGVRIPGMPAPRSREAGTSALKVGPGFFSAMQIPLVLGREIQERDTAASARVAVVNETFVRKYFPGQTPLGRRFGTGDENTLEIEIIGVSRDSRYNSLKQDTSPVVFTPYTMELHGIGGMTFEIRTQGDPLALASTLATVVREADPRIPIANVSTQSRVIDQTISQERTFGQLCSWFAVLALLMSCVGLYGTMAYSVARRTGEIGIRMALGARRGAVIWTILRDVLRLASAGVVIGLAAAWAGGRFIQSLLYGVRRDDPLAITISVLILTAASLLAGYIPAARASRIDPCTALRHE